MENRKGTIETVNPRKEERVLATIHRTIMGWRLEARKVAWRTKETKSLAQV